MRGRRRASAVGLVCGLVLGAGAGCTGSPQVATFIDKGVPAGSFQLVGFNSCADALNGLRSAAKSMVGPYGFGGDMAAEVGPDRAAGPDAAGDGAAPPMAAEPGAARGGSSVGVAPEPNYSGTNTHEAGVDEPDLVKTDGRRILTISRGVLYVVDAASRSMAGFVELADPQDPNDLVRYTPADLLLAGDHALVLLREQAAFRSPVIVDGGPPGADAPRVQPTRPDQQLVLGPRLILVDLSGQPQVLASYRIDGGLVDARQVGSTARVVIRSYPRLEFPYLQQGTDAERTARNKEIIDRASLDDWLPRIEITNGADVQRARVNCEAIVRPAVYTGTNLLTVLTFELRADSLGHGNPVTVVADGDTVYSNGPSLYVASDQRWLATARLTGGAPADASQPEPRTDIYKFNTPGGQPPRFAAGGSVPGYLINQYAMSEWDGKLRVATTTVAPWVAPGQRTTSQSGVYVLAPSGKRLRQVGHVDGLGKGERIYAVRFTGPLGYVVTFRQTDPLYTLDLGDPARPAVRGELKISGYSAYLHPVGGDKLIGIGQEATSRGVVTGTQVSLFSVADLGEPRRLARYHLSGGQSEAEFDPHAFLYWPDDGLLVVPLQLPGVVPVPGGIGGGVAPDLQKLAAASGALVLRIAENRIDEVGFISHPMSFQNAGYSAVIRRSLIIDRTLWTVSDAGLLATNLPSLARLAWIPLA